MLADVLWYYIGIDGEIHGPHTSYEMLYWTMDSAMPDVTPLRTALDKRWHLLLEWKRQSGGQLPFTMPVRSMAHLLRRNAERERREETKARRIAAWRRQPSYATRAAAARKRAAEASEARALAQQLGQDNDNLQPSDEQVPRRVSISDLFPNVDQSSLPAQNSTTPSYHQHQPPVFPPFSTKRRPPMSAYRGRGRGRGRGRYSSYNSRGTRNPYGFLAPGVPPFPPQFGPPTMMGGFFSQFPFFMPPQFVPRGASALRRSRGAMTRGGRQQHLAPRFATRGLAPWRGKNAVPRGHAAPRARASTVPTAVRGRGQSGGDKRNRQRGERPRMTTAKVMLEQIEDANPKRATGGAESPLSIPGFQMPEDPTLLQLLFPALTPSIQDTLTPKPHSSTRIKRDSNTAARMLHSQATSTPDDKSFFSLANHSIEEHKITTADDSHRQESSLEFSSLFLHKYVSRNVDGSEEEGFVQSLESEKGTTSEEALRMSEGFVLNLSDITTNASGDASREDEKEGKEMENGSTEKRENERNKLTEKKEKEEDPIIIELPPLLPPLPEGTRPRRRRLESYIAFYDSGGRPKPTLQDNGCNTLPIKISREQASRILSQLINQPVIVVYEKKKTTKETENP